MSQTAITVVGLGPGDPGLLTVEAVRLLETYPVVLRTRIHPTIAALPGAQAWESFDALYDVAADFDSLYNQIVEGLIEWSSSGPIVYAVPGHPLVGESTVRRLMTTAEERGVAVRVCAGVSFLDVLAVELGIDPVNENLQVVDALELVASVDRSPFGGGRLPLSPLRPAVVAQLHSSRVASLTKLALMRLYPDPTPVTLVSAAGTRDYRVATVPLYQLDHEAVDHLTTLYLPALDPLVATKTIDALQQIVARLRGPGGCPWDREQTHASLAKHLLEETYEAVAAIEAGDTDELIEELGDVLLQVLLHAQLAEEADDFVLEDVFERLGSKLVRRHPHVFGSAAAATPGEVVAVWDRIKQAERGQDEVSGAPDPFKGIPAALPALSRAQLALRRARGLSGTAAAAEGAANSQRPRLQTETELRRIGSELAALVRRADELGIDAEQALRQWTRQFERDTIDRLTSTG